MPTVVGVRLRPFGKVLSFDAAETGCEPGDFVIVSTERGEEFGEVATGPTEVDEPDLERPLKPVLRLASEEDVEKVSELEERERDAMTTYRRLVDEHGLDMKPVRVEWLFDEKKVAFYFVAEERVDFRELVKDLARHFRTRIDMRQIGVRDEARLVGGLGHCGQQLCCIRFGDDFQPVGIRMAKAQDLPLNPAKISGLCGRLMCCLRYEYESYQDFKSRAPKVGSSVDTPRGDAKVIALDAPRERVTIEMGGGRVTVPLATMECDECGGRPCRVPGHVIEEIERSSLSALDRLVESASEEKKRQRSKRPPGEGQRKKPGDSKPGEGGRRRKKRRGSRKRSGGGSGKQEGAKAGAGSGGKGGAKQGASGSKAAERGGTPGGKGGAPGGKGGGARGRGTAKQGGAPADGRTRRRRRRPPSQDGSSGGGGGARGGG